MIAPAVKMATALDPYVVRVVFADGEVRDVDIEPLLGGPIFEELREPRSFAQVEVDEYGETIVWPNGADLDPDVLYGLAEPPSGPAPRVSIPGSRLTPSRLPFPFRPVGVRVPVRPRGLADAPPISRVRRKPRQPEQPAPAGRLRLGLTRFR